MSTVVNKAVNGTVSYVDDRTSIGGFVKFFARKLFPDHWSFMLGEVALYSFVILLLTGVFLTAFFVPSMNLIVYEGSLETMHGVIMSEAFASTVNMSFDIPGGILMRQMHHWAALLFNAAILVHMSRIFFTGAFRKPREINWLVGFTLMILAPAAGFTGYSLPDDVLSGNGLRIIDGIIKSVPIIGTSPDAIDRAEDRERFQQLIQKLGLKQPPNRTVRSVDESFRAAEEIGYPLVVRPSYVLGGRAMEIVYNQEELKRYMHDAVKVSNESPVLLDYFLNAAIELDIDLVSDGKQAVVGAIMQHIEQAGIHSGDSACSLPPYNLPAEVQDKIREQVKALALELGVVGLMNTQLAYQDGELYVIEVNPRASRTVPFVSKCIGRSLAKVAARCMAGTSLAEQGFEKEIVPQTYAVKEAIFPFNKFPGVDPILGPEMKSTGEVMGVGLTFAEAYAKAQMGAGENFATSGNAFISVREADKSAVVEVARQTLALGYNIVATHGTAQVIADAGLPVTRVNKVAEGRPHIVDMLKNDEIQLVFNTTEGKQAIADSSMIRRTALRHRVFCTTTIAGALAVCEALAYGSDMSVYTLQDLHAQIESA
mgnify:CR=1 FL=1